ncbi:MAG TPA: AAA family ATPase [Thermoanaerobaculia bacterium]|nr:AAA family ATPase [Thermoanaerobaculia bacterium]
MSGAFDRYPDWARTLAHGIRARLGNTFVLHGNTHDLVSVPKSPDAPRQSGDFVPLTNFLADFVFGQREVVIEYQRANGPAFHTRASHKHFTDVVSVVDAVHGTELARSLPREPSVFFPLLDSFLKQVIHREAPLGVAIIFPYVETLIPESGESGAEDRAVRVFIQKWATDPALLAANVTFVLMTENLADISARIVRSPQTVEIEVKRPDSAERLQYLQAIRDAEWFDRNSELPAERLAQLTSGLTRIQLRQILSSVDEHGTRLDTTTLRNQKKAVIEAECFGLLEYVESRFALDMVSGHEGIKEKMRRAARAILAGRLRGVPMGYLIAGPVGSAKTFLVNCFTGEIGFPCVQFLNFRSQWQGVTEGNLEKILKLLRAMWPVGVIIDEADAFLGDRNQQGDSGTSNRVFAQLSSFMGNTEYRGKIVWFLITCRPDLLPVDIKRQGRAEEHLALFYPETAEEHDALFRIMLKKSGMKTDVQSIAEVADDASGLSGADIEAILARALLASDAAGAAIDHAVSLETLRHAFADFIPATSPLERELQILVAVQECTSREVLPESYRSMERSTVQERINELRRLLIS